MIGRAERRAETERPKDGCLKSGAILSEQNQSQVNPYRIIEIDARELTQPEGARQTPSPLD